MLSANPPHRRWPLVVVPSLLMLLTGVLLLYRPLAGVVFLETDSDGPSVYDLAVAGLDGRPVHLDAYRGQVALVVNVASECGLATQYPDIERLYQRHRQRGFVVLAFPSNDFGWQEPGTSEDIRRTCDIRGITFPVFARTGVRSREGQSPVYALLTSAGPRPQWNFAKFLIGRDGMPRAFFGSLVQPGHASVESAIEAALAEPPAR